MERKDNQFKPGRKDVMADMDGCRHVVAKAGIIDTQHLEQKSKLCRHLHTTIGMLLVDHEDADRLMAAVP